MDSSSYYGGQPGHNPRPSSSSAPYDPPQAPPPGAGHARQDSQGTLLNARSAGYNRGSYLDAGRQEPVKGWHDDDNEERGDLGDQKDQGWDVYADFNNAGPKYSSAFGQQHAYQPIDTPHSPSATKGGFGSVAGDGHSATAAVELVTVPALGAEWKRSELRDMSKAGRREDKREERKRKWNSWKRGETSGWASRRVLTFFLFFLIIAIGVTLAFTLPRVPAISFNADQPLLVADGRLNETVETYFLRGPPANFSFPAYADLRINTDGNFIPIRFSKFKAEIIDGQTNRKVATGGPADSVTFPAKTLVDFRMPLNFSYQGSNQTDQTWLNWHDACANKNQAPSGNRPGVDFTLTLDFSIFGLFGTKRASTRILAAACPFELPSNAG